MTSHSREKLNAVFTCEAMSSEDVLDIVLTCLSKLSVPQSFRLNEHTVSVRDLRDALRVKRGYWPSRIVSNDLLFRFCRLPALGISLMSIEELAPDSTDWNVWAAHVTNPTGFIQAWKYDVDYDYWQNARDPLEYEISGRSASHLPKRSNGLPPPLEQLEIDTSQNPGRTELKRGYVEAVATTMWLGDAFWANLGISRLDELRGADWIKLTAVNSAVVRIDLSESNFCDASTAAIQNALRAVIFR